MNDKLLAEIKGFDYLEKIGFKEEETPTEHGLYHEWVIGNGELKIVVNCWFDVLLRYKTCEDVQVECNSKSTLIDLVEMIEIDN